jgi:imidazolonepropionase
MLAGMAERGGAIAAGMATAAGSPPLRAGSLSAVETAGPAAVAWDENGIIVYAGPASGMPWEPSAGSPDAGLLIPGFVDCHVHLPFFGWRADEYEARLAGVSYREMHGQEGGIYRSSQMLSEASDDEVIDFCMPLVAEMSTCGTTTLELKTGYGLSVEQELRQARLARRLAERIPQTCTVTLLGCHAIPKDADRAAWVREVCDELIPAASAEGLVDQADVYVEDIAFSLDDLEALAAAASQHGLPLRVHADQLGRSGAAEAAVRLGARSADHLNHVSPEGVAALAGASTAAVLLPASTAFLGLPPAPVAQMRSAGVSLAVATDFNPGTSPVLSMPQAIATACSLYGLSPLEALTATTANAAWVLGQHDVAGRLEPGLRADVVLLDAPSFAHVPYRPGHCPVSATWVGGRLVHSR